MMPELFSELHSSRPFSCSDLIGCVKSDDMNMRHLCLTDLILFVKYSFCEMFFLKVNFFKIMTWFNTFTFLSVAEVSTVIGSVM